jgi:zinc/manganese transport system substrate-binding protein
VTQRDRPARRFGRAAALTTAAALTVALLGGPPVGAATDHGATPRGRVVSVVAAEDFWGSIASQLGGVHAHVVSIITNPTIDPHSYEPTTQDARTLAAARFVIENGIGYDPWVPKLLAADETSPLVLNVGDRLGVPDGGNPHRWYDPGDVQTVINQIVADYQRLDPADRGYFTAQQARFDTVALRPYDLAIAAIRSQYAGTPVGASESIFALLAPSLDLKLITPPSFLRAISEGTDVTAADRETIDRQISEHRIKIYVYNSQNVTPDVQAQLREVKAARIPYATITETLAPAGTTYQAWQTRQLLRIEAALATAARQGGR